MDICLEARSVYECVSGAMSKLLYMLFLSIKTKLSEVCLTWLGRARTPKSFSIHPHMVNISDASQAANMLKESGTR